MVYEVEAIFSQSVGLEPRKTLNWSSLFCAVPSLFIQYTRMNPSYRGCVLHVKNRMKP